MVRTFAEAFVIFTVSLIVLCVGYIIAGANTGKATGIGWVHWKGMVLMVVGALYFVTGLILTRLK